MSAVIALVLLLLGVMASDFARRRVPNSLMAFGALGAAMAWLLESPPPVPPDGMQQVLGGLLGLLGLLPLYALGRMGAGDVKFAAVLGLWLGPVPLLIACLGGHVLGGLHAALWLLLQRWSVLPGLKRALAGPTATRATGIRSPCRVPLAGYMAITTLVWMARQHSG
jgi:prepilin peptidase CpaA